MSKESGFNRDTWFGIIAGAVVALIIGVALLTGPPFWVAWLPGISSTSASPTDGPPSQNPGVIGFIGGCAPFQVYAQNRWLPYGAAIRSGPSVVDKQIGARDPNQSFTVNGWVHSMVAYPTNSPPWNNDIWFHLSDGAGWVSFGGIRAHPTFNDPTLVGDGGPPVPLDPSCQGSAQ